MKRTTLPEICRYAYCFTSITLLVIVTSCSHRYQMAKNYKYEAGPMQMIKLDNVWMRIRLYPTDKYEQEFNLTCAFDYVAEGKTPKLSGLKITFINAETGDTAAITQPVELNSHMHKDTTSHTEYMTNEALQTSKVFDLNERMFYIFSYHFKGNNQQQPITKIQINVEATLDNEGKIVAINKTYPFKKVYYLNISGN